MTNSLLPAAAFPCPQSQNMPRPGGYLRFCNRTHQLPGMPLHFKSLDSPSTKYCKETIQRVMCLCTHKGTF